jgi:hypothetical protein
VQLFKNTKVRWVLQVASVGCCFRKACFFNDLSESTKVVEGLQGWGLLKRWFVVEKGLILGFRFGGMDEPQVPPLRFHGTPHGTPGQAGQVASVGMTILL